MVFIINLIIEMSEIENHLKEARPNLSSGSLRTYVSIIKNLGKQMKQEFNSPKDVIKHYKDVIAHLKDVAPKVRKTRLAGLVVFISKTDGNETAIEKFRELMMDDKKTADEEVKEQKLSDRQREGWMTWDEVMGKYEELKRDVAHLWKKASLDKREFQKLQLFVLLSLITLIPPRRSLDWTAFKLKDVDAEKDNHMTYEKRKPVFVFNTYKTRKTNGVQKEAIPPALHAIMKQWMKVNPHAHLLMNYNQTAGMNQTQVTQMLHGFFGKPVSTSLLRHIYLTGKYGNIPALKEMEKTAEAMGHSLQESLQYVKKE